MDEAPRLRPSRPGASPAPSGSAASHEPPAKKPSPQRFDPLTRCGCGCLLVLVAALIPLTCIARQNARQRIQLAPRIGEPLPELEARLRAAGVAYELYEGEGGDGTRYRRIRYASGGAIQLAEIVDGKVTGAWSYHR